MSDSYDDRKEDGDYSPTLSHRKEDCPCQYARDMGDDCICTSSGQLSRACKCSRCIPCEDSTMDWETSPASSELSPNVFSYTCHLIDQSSSASSKCPFCRFPQLSDGCDAKAPTLSDSDVGTLAHSPASMGYPFLSGAMMMTMTSPSPRHIIIPIQLLRRSF